MEDRYILAEVDIPAEVDSLAEVDIPAGEGRVAEACMDRELAGSLVQGTLEGISYCSKVFTKILKSA